MSQININKTVLMSGADYFDDQSAINPYMDKTVTIDIQQAKQEHAQIKTALEQAGVKVIQVQPPLNCQDGVYTANWGLVRGDKVVLSNLPDARKAEEAYADSVLKKLGKTTVKLPGNIRFSGQGDALPCGEYLFVGSVYRTDHEAHNLLAKELGYKVIGLQTVPKRGFGGLGKPLINADSGWPDSFYYDLDLALAVLKGPSGKSLGLIAWCPAAFVPQSRKVLEKLEGFEKIEVDKKEAQKGFACNLVSTGETVIMSAHAPKLKRAIEAKGLKVMTIDAPELAKGGGFIRCTTLTLDS